MALKTWELVFSLASGHEVVALRVAYAIELTVGNTVFAGCQIPPPETRIG